MSNLFQRLELQAFRAGITPRTKESREWFRKKASNLRSINREDLMKEEPLKTGARQIVGSMQMFFYDPKTKDTLPYYDKFPLAIIVSPCQGWFLWIEYPLSTPSITSKVPRCLDGYRR